MKYYLIVDIDPKKHYIHVKGKIKGLLCNVFYFNENFNILNVLSNGKKIDWNMDKEQPHPAFDTVSRPIIFQTENNEIEFEYDGYICEVINDINQIDEEIVELASYSGWYPKPENLDVYFDFELELSLPNNYEIASNGIIVDYNHISSVIRETDIVIFASNQVKRCEFSDNNKNACFCFLRTCFHKCKDMLMIL